MDSLFDNILLPVESYAFSGLENYKVALVFICTGKGYCDLFLDQAIERAKEFFPSDILVFTDSEKQYPIAKQVFKQHSGWPEVTLKRYHTIISEEEWLSQRDYIFHFDVDMKLMQKITDDILSDGITVTKHPDFENGGGATDQNPKSHACLSDKDIRQYVTGAFQGGTSKAFLSMAKTIALNIDDDARNGVIARVYDESHLNRYVYDNPPAKILSTDYCCKYHKGEGTAYIECMDEYDAAKEGFRR
jgi:hypothetical protein